MKTPVHIILLKIYLTLYTLSLDIQNMYLLKTYFIIFSFDLIKLHQRKELNSINRFVQTKGQTK